MKSKNESSAPYFFGMGCNGYKKKCWQKEKAGALCGTCEFTKQKEKFNAVLSQNIALIKIYTNLESLSLAHGDKGSAVDKGSIIARDTYFDRLVRRLLDDKAFLKDFLEKNKSRFEYRVYTHSESELCDVVCWALHTAKMDIPIPNACLKCLAHTLRYSSDKYTRSLILRSVIFSYNDGPKIQTIARRMKKESSLYEFGAAIIEQQGGNGVYETYMDVIQDKTQVVSALNEHPLLHITQETQDIHIKQRKLQEFKDELMTAAYEPSRAFEWCLAEEDKKGWMGLP